MPFYNLRYGFPELLTVSSSFPSMRSRYCGNKRRLFTTMDPIDTMLSLLVDDDKNQDSDDEGDIIHQDQQQQRQCNANNSNNKKRRKTQQQQQQEEQTMTEQKNDNDTGKNSDNNNDSKKNSVIDRILYQNRSMVIIENNDSFVVRYDVPGVQVTNITVTLNPEDNVLTIDAKRYYDTSFSASKRNVAASSYSRAVTLGTIIDKIHVNNINATILDGVLSVTMPKKKKKNDEGTTATKEEEGVMLIEVKASDPPTTWVSSKNNKNNNDNDNNDTIVTYTFDLPGIKTDNVNVTYENGQLLIHAERNSKNKVYHHRYAIDAKKYNVSTFQGYLSDGVLTIGVKRRSVRPTMTIPVVVAGSTPASIAPTSPSSLLIANNNNNNNTTKVDKNNNTESNVEEKQEKKKVATEEEATTTVATPSLAGTKEEKSQEESNPVTETSDRASP